MDEPRKTLPFTATTTSGAVVEFALPLHPHTTSAEHVGELLEAVLEALTTVIEGEQAVSDGDVLQALSLALAIRLSVAGIGPETAEQLVGELAEMALDGAATAEHVASSGRRH